MIAIHDPDFTNSAPASSPEEASSSSGFLSYSEAISPDAQTAWRFWLASASPRRSQLLENIGLPFDLLPNTFEEPEPSADDEANPATYVERLSRSKAAACETQKIDSGHPAGESMPLSQERVKHLIVTADTIVWHDGHILNKPRDTEHASQMLRQLRGQTHQVFTGICLRLVTTGPKYFEGAALNEEFVEEEYFVAHEVTKVRFREASDSWIAAYVATGEPLDKAGAYAAQGGGATLIEAIDGDYFNVVGLPLCRLAQMLEQLGAPIEAFWKLKSET